MPRTSVKGCWKELFDAGFLATSPRRKAILLMWRGPEFKYWATRGVITRTHYLPIPSAGQATLPRDVVGRYVRIVFPRRVESYTEPMYEFYKPRTKRLERPVEDFSHWTGNEVFDESQEMNHTQVRGPPQPETELLTQAI